MPTPTSSLAANATPRSPVLQAGVRSVAVLVETDTSSGCSVIRGIANYAETHGDWHLLIDPRDHEQRSALPDGWTGAGVIARLSTRLQLEQIAARRMPVVNVDDLYDDLTGAPSVVTDEEELGRMALAHLLDRGFRHFAYFAPPSHQYSKKRGEAFREIVKEAGYECIEYKPGYRAGRILSWAEQQQRASRWLSSLPRPVAVLTVQAHQARQLAEICHFTGVRVPDDVAILAGDADDLMCEVSTPPLSNINVASEKIGHDAAELLDRIIAGEPAPKEPIRIPPRGVTSRQSTDLLAIDDSMIVDALRFIRKHACRGIVVDDILRDIPISRRTLEIQFRHYLGRSPAKEIRRVQLERAQELLGKPELSITEVGLACGFSNATRFGVAFKKENERTPQAFRKNLLSGQKINTGSF
ncbi:Xylose operon regulatory protein [Pirellulimonas nuda]|uniref:Xylose operon regulatory protein n=2 Tax=Pirellulimonas nuda TaxID=2528009 RepID=A0A518DAL3_9BACT|nr:Xylose operon regulatory protein [Pirellulimonas nuda]